MKTALKYILGLAIFLGGLSVLANQFNVGKDTLQPQSDRHFPASISSDRDGM